MRPNTFEIVPDDTVTDGYADDVGEHDLDGFANDSADDVGATGFMVITEHDTPDGFGHKVVFTPSGSITGEFDLVGVDENGVALSETVETDTGNAVTSVGFYATLTSVTTPAGIGSETVDIGWSADGAKLTLAETATPDGLARGVIITPSGSVSGSYTIVGTDLYGVAQSETLATNAGSAVTSSKHFKTVTSVTGATIGAETVDIGWAGTIGGIVYPIDWRSPFACNISVDVTGTINYTVQQSFSDVLGGETPVWSDITALASKTADLASQAAVGATAVRLLVNSYTDGASISMTTSQASFI